MFTFFDFFLSFFRCIWNNYLIRTSDFPKENSPMKRREHLNVLIKMRLYVFEI